MSLFRKIAFWCVICAALWLGGLFWFIDQIPAEPNPDNRHTDAIVVLTGGSGRLEYGLQLLADGESNTLFISGVSHNLTVDDILHHALPQLQLKLQPMENHIILGHDAENTIGNAEETARWLKSTQVHSIRLVTANYHMPRSIEEFEDTVPGIVIVPAPVFPDDFNLSNWWEHDYSRMLLLSEYHKYFASKLRHWLVSMLRHP